MSFLKFVIAFLFFFSWSAQADIFDRIDICEKSGGSSCVFNILRELAQKSGGGGKTGKTSCQTYAPYTGEICCTISCYEPKIARCYQPSHPSFCRDAVCRCEEQ